MQELSVEIENYLFVCKEIKRLSPLTVKAYRIDLTQYYFFSERKDIFSKKCITEYIDYLYKQFKPKSAKRKIASMKAFYHYLEMEDLIELNPFHKINYKPMEPTVLPKTIPLEVIEIIIKYAYQQYYSASTVFQKETTLRNLLILELLFFTGMRVSEVSSLRTTNIDLNNKTVYIIGKGSKERITCLANEDIVKLLKQYVYIRKSSSSFLFLNRVDRPYSDQSIRNMIKQYTKAAGVDIHITPHMFRHTFATALLEEDVNIRYIQQLLGHSSIVTTQIYTHISTNKIRQLLKDKHPRNKYSF